MKRFLAASFCMITLAIGTQAAVAADIPVHTKAPVSKLFAPEPVHSWTGIYVGVGAGFASSVSELNVAVPVATANINLDGFGADGGLLAVSIGADYQFSSNFVAGVFFDYAWHSAELTASLNALAGAVTGNISADLQNQWFLGARLGWLSSPSTLWFLSGGYTVVDISDLSATGALGPLAGGLTIGIPDFDGWFVGFGVESMLWNNLSIKAEYRYADYSSEALNLPTVGGINLNNFATATLQPRVQTGVLSLNYRFNGW